MRKDRLLSLLKIGFSMALLAILLSQVGWQQTLETLGKAKLPHLAAAFVLYLVGIVVRAYRWRILLSALNMDIPLAKLTALYFIRNLLQQHPAHRHRRGCGAGLRALQAEQETSGLRWKIEVDIHSHSGYNL